MNVLDALSRDDPKSSLDPRYFPTGAVLERPTAQRPKHDTVDGIIEWLAGPAQHVPSLGDEFDEFAWRMVAAGFPLLRVTLELRTLHPQYLGANFVWWRTTGRTVLTFVTHEDQDLFGHEDNPVRRVLVGGETLRRRVDIPDHELDFPVLHISRQKAPPTILPSPSRARSARTIWQPTLPTVSAASPQARFRI